MTYHLINHISTKAYHLLNNYFRGNRAESRIVIVNINEMIIIISHLRHLIARTDRPIECMETVPPSSPSFQLNRNSLLHLREKMGTQSEIAMNQLN